MKCAKCGEEILTTTEQVKALKERIATLEVQRDQFGAALESALQALQERGIEL